MINPANLQLSSEEMRLASDPGWILTKNSIMAKVVGMLGALSGTYREIWSAGGSTGIEPGDPRVSRGENYRGLPWVMLDYPRIWGREDILAIRTMFWWGHSFSVTLHLKGQYLHLFLPVILLRREELAAAGFFVGIHEDEWRHEHTPEVFAPLGAGTVGHRGFLKLSAAVGLDRWSEAPKLLAELFEVLVSVLREG